MIPRRSFITLLGGAAASWPVVARGQQPERVRRIGMISAIEDDDPQTQRRLASRCHPRCSPAQLR